MSDFHRLNHKLPPTILTIFGATGDLSADYLVPALLHMVTENMVPEDFRLICVGRRDFNSKTYLDFIVKKSRVLRSLSPQKRKKFLKILSYHKGDFQNPESYRPLARLLEDREKPKHRCYNRLFYFATSPQYFASITSILKTAGLLRACARHEKKIRVASL